MDFFAQQDEARKISTILLSLYSIAIIFIIAAVYAVLWLMLPFLGFAPFDHFWDTELFAWVTAGTLTIIISGSLYRISELSDGGGEAVARMVGGVALDQGSRQPLDRRLLNVVAEMAIAAGTPVPPVFVLPQNGINAFAAGFSPSEAVIGVTRGAMQLLNRDELQGVIGHEFSHILNGDMRMKMKLMGLLHGITMIGDIGISLMTTRRARVSYRASRGGISPNLAVIVLGLLLFMLGTIGLVFSDMIKRAISRQREFLADASAVQFTRNPSGLAGALKVIGGYKQGARVDHPGTGQTNHFFFGNPKKSRPTDLWASHPPLAERIRRIEPQFSGIFDHIEPVAKLQASTDEAAAMGFVAETSSSLSSIPALKSSDALASIGNPRIEHINQARCIAASIPKPLQAAAQDAYLARAAVYALLLSTDSPVRKKQLAALEEKADPKVFRETLAIQPETARLSAELRLPLVNLLMPALRHLSEAQYNTFRSSIHRLIRADKKLSLFEYSLQKVLFHHLARVFGTSEPEITQYHSLQPLLPDCACLLALMARLGQKGENTQKAFVAAMQTLDRQASPALPEQKVCGIKQFDMALDKLRLALPHIKRRVLAACVTCASSNNQISIGEAELLRAISAGLDCPMPPFLPGQVPA